MEKIELTKDEIKVIKQHLSGKFDVWNATEYQQRHLSSVIDKADELMEKLNAYDELDQYKDMSSIQWLYDKYRSQQNGGK